MKRISYILYKDICKFRGNASTVEGRNCFYLNYKKRPRECCEQNCRIYNHLKEAAMSTSEKICAIIVGIMILTVFYIQGMDISKMQTWQAGMDNRTDWLRVQTTRNATGVDVCLETVNRLMDYMGIKG